MSDEIANLRDSVLMLSEQNDEYRAEIGRLRAALRRVRDLTPLRTHVQIEIHAIIRAALWEDDDGK
jgi:hypothetical protein